MFYIQILLFPYNNPVYDLLLRDFIYKFVSDLIVFTMRKTTVMDKPQKHGGFIRARGVKNRGAYRTGEIYLYRAFAHHGLSTQVQADICVAIEGKRKLCLQDYPMIEHHITI